MRDDELLQAACRGEDPEIFFGGANLAAKRICAPCPVRDACLESALQVELFEYIKTRDDGRSGAVRNHGVYGGWTANERKPVIYRRAATMQAA